MGCSASRHDVVDRRTFCIAVVGLDNAGKSTVVNNITGNYQGLITPTIGFASFKADTPDAELTLYDLGGGSNIRQYWSKYYHELHGLIFVVDSSTIAARSADVEAALTSTANDKMVAGKPILVLANKQDLPDAWSPGEIVKAIGLDRLQNITYHVEQCIAYVKPNPDDTSGPGVPVPDASIPRGVQWLIGAIQKDLDALERRTQADTAAWREQEAQRKEEQRRRVSQIRAAREASEKAAAASETLSPGDKATVAPQT
ncbi:ADP-ribosylation factor-like protein 13B [Plasmodiophora brassicae]